VLLEPILNSPAPVSRLLQSTEVRRDFDAHTFEQLVSVLFKLWRHFDDEGVLIE